MFLKFCSNEHTLKLLLRQRYHRIDTDLHEEMALDDVYALNELIAAADAVDLTETIEYLFTSFLADHDSE
jgi:hypothetical protein